jgi:drug/metabolite transporter (DMT)-like permease
MIGAVAIVFSAIVYSLGSVVARPLTRTISPVFMSGLTFSGRASADAGGIGA